MIRVYAKTGVQLTGAILLAILPIISSGTLLDASGWVNVAITGVGGAVVWNTTNHPEWPYGKLIGSALITSLTTLNSFLSMGGASREEIVQIVLAFITTVSVGLIPNASPPPPSQEEIQQSNMNPELAS